MAKKLVYRRHSTKGTDNLLTPEGIALAVAEGRKAAEERFKDCEGWHDESPHTPFFHGPLARTAQTALAFSTAWPDITPMPAVVEIGDDNLFGEMATPALRDAVKAGASNFEAVLAVHGKDKAREWGGAAVDGLMKMFAAMEDGETAVAFGHSPVIELAAWWVAGTQMLESHTRLGDMEGIVFIEECGPDGVWTIRVAEKIAVEK